MQVDAVSEEDPVIRIRWRPDEKNYWGEGWLEEGRYILLYGFDYRYPEWGERGSQELESRDGIVYSIDPCLREYGFQ